MKFGKKIKPRKDGKHRIFKWHLLMCVCLYLCHSMWWRSEANFWEVDCLYCVGAGDQTQVCWRGSKYLNPLSPLTARKGTFADLLGSC